MNGLASPRDIGEPLNASSQPTIIVESGAEGGSIKVLKRTGSGGAEYSVQLRDQTLKFLSEEEPGFVATRHGRRNGTTIQSLGR
jgi:hypothetical protein